MTSKCPHCDKTIQLVGAAELDLEYNLNATRLQYRRGKGKFPEPWLSFGNRKIYLKTDIDAYKAEQGRVNAGKISKTLRDILDGLPPDEAKKVLEELTKPSKG